MPLTLNDVSAWVEVDGKELEQYGVEEDPEHNQVTCWIATQVDKNFAVAFRDNAVYREHALCSVLHLDGSDVGGRVLHPSTPGFLSKSRTKVQDTETLSPTSSRSFMFSKVEPTEEEEYLNQGSAHLGEIQIRMYRAQYCGTVPFKEVGGAPSHAKVHERGKKAVTHCVSYGQEMKTSTPYACSLKYLDGRVPLVTFIFKYRDFGLLQANGIIPKQPPGRKKPIVSDDALDLTIGDDIKREAVDGDIEIVEDAYQGRKRTAVSMKKFSSGHESVARHAKRIKRERESVSTGEVIDLT